jgi:5'(3')-deoxyribonucleotidase
MRKTQILLDMDGVLVDFLSGALKSLNRDFNKTVTIEQYAKEFAQWGIYDYYGITIKEFWQSIENTPNFWINLDPMPWCGQLYSMLSEIGDVTIVTSPSEDTDCVRQKLVWLRHHLGVKPDSVFLGSRKYLMAGNGILIDDYFKNCDSFRNAGGQAVLVPSNWNTNNLTWDKIWNTILTTIDKEL